MQLLYKVQAVWPPPQLMDETPTERSYTIPPGIHEYPFSFKVYRLSGLEGPPTDSGRYPSIMLVTLRILLRPTLASWA